jgi:hypothetical protein
MTSEHSRVMAQAPAASLAVDDGSAAPRSSGRLRAARDALVGGVGFVLGLLPHVLHHVAFLAGTALAAGSGGTALFGALGLLASVPFLLRLRRRFGTWMAPAIGLLVFVTMFSLSAFVIGPAISGTGSVQRPSAPTVDHSSHH